MHVLSNTAKASRIPSRRLETRWRALGVSLLLSLALHLAVVLPLFLQKPQLRADDAAPTLIVARLEPPEPPAPPPAQPSPGERGSVRQPVHRKSPAPPAAAPTQRVAYVATRAAYHEVPDEVQVEKLRDAQLRVPRSIGLVQPAKPAGPLRVVYPPAQLARGEAGHVVLEVFVSSSGRVDQIVVLDQVGHADFAKAASEALRRARFRPAEGPEGKVRSRVTLRVDFSYE